MNKLPRVAVLGIGGVGGVTSASLQTAGRCELTLVARGKALDTIRKNGLTVNLHEGTKVSCRPNVIATNETDELGAQDYVFIATKAHDFEKALPALAPMIGPNTVVIPLHNGLPHWFFTKRSDKDSNIHLKSVDPNGKLLRTVESERVIGCIGFVSGHQVDSGFYKHWYSKSPTDRNRFILGDPLGLNRETPISNLFEGSEVPIQIDIAHDIRAQIFDKLLINCSVNTIGAISRLDCGEIVDIEDTRQLLRHITAEVTNVAQSLTPPINPSLDADQIIDLYKNQYGLKPSMLQDLESNKPLEIRPIVSSVVEFGDYQGVPVPTLRTMNLLLNTIQRTKETKSETNGSHPAFASNCFYRVSYH